MIKLPRRDVRMASALAGQPEATFSAPKGMPEGMSERHHRVLAKHGYSCDEHGSGHYRYVHKDGKHEVSHDTFERKSHVMEVGKEGVLHTASNHGELDAHLSKIHGKR